MKQKGDKMSEKEKKTAVQPLCLQIRDVKTELVATVNKAIRERGLPCCILRPIVEELLASVKDAEINELAAAEQQYAAELRKEETEK